MAAGSMTSSNEARGRDDGKPCRAGGGAIPDSVADAVKRGVRAAGIAVQWGKKPLCIVHVLTI